METPRVVLYGHQGCPGTQAARAYFARHTVRHTFMDVGRDPAAASEWRALGGIGTPLIAVGRRVLLGFDPGLFLAAYQDAAGDPEGRGGGIG